MNELLEDKCPAIHDFQLRIVLSRHERRKAGNFALLTGDLNGLCRRVLLIYRNIAIKLQRYSR